MTVTEMKKGSGRQQQDTIASHNSRAGPSCLYGLPVFWQSTAWRIRRHYIQAVLHLLHRWCWVHVTVHALTDLLADGLSLSGIQHSCTFAAWSLLSRCSVQHIAMQLCIAAMSWACECLIVIFVGMAICQAVQLHHDWPSGTHLNVAFAALNMS